MLVFGNLTFWHTCQLPNSFLANLAVPFLFYIYIYLMLFISDAFIFIILTFWYNKFFSNIWKNKKYSKIDIKKIKWKLINLFILLSEKVTKIINWMHVFLFGNDEMLFRIFWSLCAKKVSANQPKLYSLHVFSIVYVPKKWLPFLAISYFGIWLIKCHIFSLSNYLAV